MKKPDQNLNLSDESLIGLLNYILSMIKEDRNNAMMHHDTLAVMLSGAPGAEGMSGIELQLLLNDLSAALTGFLKNTATATDQAIKIAKIMAEHLVKMDKSTTLTEEDRKQIDEALENLQSERDALGNIISIGG